MGKKYNSATWFGFSIYHNEKDGSDITAEQIRAKLKIALSCSDDQLRDMVLGNLSDTVKNMHYKETIKCGGCEHTAEDIKVKLRKALSSSDEELKDMILSNLSDTVENMHRKETITCGGCKQTAEIGKGFSKEDWTYSWIDIPLCDDCYTEVRVMIADRFDIKNWGRIDL